MLRVLFTIFFLKLMSQNPLFQIKNKKIIKFILKINLIKNSNFFLPSNKTKINQQLNT